MRQLRRSAYYNDYLVPNRAIDSAGLGVRLKGGGRADLVLNYPRRLPSSTAHRNLCLLTLLLPAFKAGVRTYAHRALHAGALTTAVDRLAEGVVLSDVAGRVLHQNPALTRMLGLDPERAKLANAVSEVATALARFSRACGSRALGPLPDAVVRSVCTTLAQYRVRASYVASALDDGGTVVLVTVERAGAEPPAPEALRQRWRLTERECQVAQCLMRGKSDAVIAHALGTSVHTARHHAESVRQKLGVHSRQDVEQAIQQLSEVRAQGLSPAPINH